RSHSIYLPPLHDALPILRDHPGRAVSARVEQLSPRRIVTENIVDEVELTEYSTETPADAGLGEAVAGGRGQSITAPGAAVGRRRSEEHTSELQSREKLVC